MSPWLCRTLPDFRIIYFMVRFGWANITHSFIDLKEEGPEGGGDFTGAAVACVRFLGYFFAHVHARFTRTLIPGFCSAIKHTAPVKCLPCIIHSYSQGELWLSNPTQYEQHVVLWADQASASTLQSYILFCVLYIQATIKYLITAWMILISYCVNWVGWQRRAWRARERKLPNEVCLCGRVKCLKNTQWCSKATGRP